VVLPSGQIEVLATSLLDEAEYPASVFGQLYQQRWRIEEAFRHIKCRLKLERFGGETPLAIRQEFHATILLHNLATLAGLDALQSLPKAERAERHVNLAHASQLLRLLIPQLLHPSGDIAALCSCLVEGIRRHFTRKRPDRTAPPRKRDRAKRAIIGLTSDCLAWRLAYFRGSAGTRELVSDRYPLIVSYRVA
jgi:hypothetical protein